MELRHLCSKTLIYITCANNIPTTDVSLTNTNPRTFSKRYVGVIRSFLFVFICESIRIKLVGLRVELRVVLDAQNWDVDSCTCRDGYRATAWGCWKLVVSCASPIDKRNRRIFTQRLWKYINRLMLRRWLGKRCSEPRVPLIFSNKIFRRSHFIDGSVNPYISNVIFVIKLFLFVCLIFLDSIKQKVYIKDVFKFR